MSLHLPARRALAAAASTARPITYKQHFRGISWFGRSKPDGKTGGSPANEIKIALQRQREKQAQEKAEAIAAQQRLNRAELGSQSIFDEKDSVQETVDSMVAGKESNQDAAKKRTKIPGYTSSYEAMCRSSDPDPRGTMRFTRRLVTRHVGRALNPYGRETKAETIARTERTLTYRGPVWHLSPKKHVKLARQIAGRTVDDAMVQMRFSKKKFSRDINFVLDAARDEAAVVAGMGLNDQSGDKVKGEKIQLKDGRWITITDPNKLYIEQAWVNNSKKMHVGFVYPARRGHVPKFTIPTNLNIILKEQRTLIRQYKEKKAKEDLRKPWVHLPNRPITAQRQHYSW